MKATEKIEVIKATYSAIFSNPLWLQPIWDTVNCYYPSKRGHLSNTILRENGYVYDRARNLRGVINDEKFEKLHGNTGIFVHSVVYHKRNSL